MHADARSRTPAIITLVVLIAITVTAIGLRSGSHRAQGAVADVSASATPFAYVVGADPSVDDPAVTTAPGTTRAAPTTSVSSSTPATTTLLASTLAANGIPSIALQAYELAAAQYDKADPSCRLPWSLLAAIGRVESNHGQFGGAVLRVDGTSTPPIIGRALNGVGTALVLATPTGITLDDDRQYDHAIGPMQIIPSTWVQYALAATGHATADPFNIFDAAVTAAHYLCVAGGDMGTSAGQLQAVFAYNHSDTYVSTVLSIENTYDAHFGVSGAGQVGTAAPSPTNLAPTSTNSPPANPGAPSAIAPDAVTSSPGPSGTDSPNPTPSASTTPGAAPTQSSDTTAPSTPSPTPTATVTTATPTPSTPPSSAVPSPSSTLSPSSPSSPSPSPTPAPSSTITTPAPTQSPAATSTPTATPS